MADIPYKYKGSILNPLKNLGFFARKPITEPMHPREASNNYRGFHVNDWEKCIGCSTCQKVCDNAAITMVRIPGLKHDPVAGVRNERPAIDYGRCCWCGLCVDICTTASLALTTEYVHTCREDELDSYFILPDSSGIHGKPFPKGWAKSDDADLVDLDRVPMSEMEPDERINSFDEVVDGFDDQRALLEASRCVQCGMCHDSCPANMHAPEYIRNIWEGNLEQAVREIYRTNPFAHVCGRVCTHRCEDACSIGRRGEPVAIQWLKRYAMDSVSDERVKEIAAETKVDYISSKKIAIIGAGPAGLTTAYDLALKGHEVKVFEALAKPGGMTRYGIPEYRLPYDRLDADVEVITSVGVVIEYNKRIGDEINMADLERDYDAVLVAIGLQQGRSTRIAGSDNPQVISSVSLLRSITNNEAFEIPQRVVVIGGGNVAMDIARSLARKQKHEYGTVQVTLAAMEDFDHFLADEVEVKESREEGVVLLESRGPTACKLDEAGKLTGLVTLGVTSIFDEQGRFAPKYNQDDEQFYPADMVVEAIGQSSDVTFFGDELTERLEWNKGRLQIDENGRTSQAWLWSAGDMVNGPDVIHAVADGHRVSASIEEFLNE
jgi:glutamate synthase (NADPH/NADH) small chain